MSFDQRAHVRSIGDPHRLVAKGYALAWRGWANLERDGLSAIEDGCALLPDLWSSGLRLLFLELVGNPVTAAFCKFLGGFDGANARNGGANGTIRLNAQDVAPGIAVPDEMDGDELGANSQEPVGRRMDRLLPKQKIERPIQRALATG